MTKLLSFLFCFITAIINVHALDKSSEMELSIPVDKREWVLLHEQLPYGQDTIWLVPSGKSWKDKEYIKIVAHEKHSKLPLVFIPTTPDGFNVYKKQTGYRSNMIAWEDTKRHQFQAILYLQGPNSVYDIIYNSPSTISETRKDLWIDRLNRVNTDSSSVDAARIVISSKGFFRDGKELAQASPGRAYVHPKQHFCLEIPKGWIYDEKQVSGDDFIAYAHFTRVDRLASGTVYIKDTTCKTKEQIDLAWQKTLNSLQKNSGLTLISQGDFTNCQGDLGKYITFKNGSKTYTRFLLVKDGKIYKIECRTDSDNYTSLQETFDAILKSFCVNFEQPSV